MKQFVKDRIHDAGFEVRRYTGGPALDQLSVALGSTGRPGTYEQVGTFTDESGNEHQVYDGYRYSVKQGWLAIPWLSGLRHIQKAGGLTDVQNDRLREIAGTRTVTVSINDIRDFAEPILTDRAASFEEENIECCAPAMSEAAYRNVIDTFAHRIEQDLATIPSLAGAEQFEVLDLGCGRGFSTAAFLSLGHDALGADYDYNSGKASASGLMRRRVARMVSRDDLFVNADMTQCPELPDGSRDLIYSVSCLEHIADIDAACREMFRVLRPGGRLLHRYNPFWAENGGHAFGILDAPWLHAVLSSKDFDRYLLEWRKHESQISLPWTRAGLNRGITIGAMQRALSAAGFQIDYWHESMRSAEDLVRLRPEVLALGQKRYPDLQLADLLATDIMFSAVKV